MKAVEFESTVTPGGQIALPADIVGEKPPGPSRSGSGGATRLTAERTSVRHLKGRRCACSTAGELLVVARTADHLSP